MKISKGEVRGSKGKESVWEGEKGEGEKERERMERKGGK